MKINEGQKPLTHKERYDQFFYQQGLRTTLPLIVMLLAFLLAGATHAFSKPEKGSALAGALLGVFALIFIVAACIWFYGTMCSPRTFTFLCDHCNRFIDFRAYWQCSRCDCWNTGEALNNFFRKCSKCSSEPTAVICLSCKQVVFLDSSQSASNTATLDRPDTKVTFDDFFQGLGAVAKIFDELAARDPIVQIQMEENLTKLYLAKKARREAQEGYRSVGRTSSAAPKSESDRKREELERERAAYLDAHEIAEEAIREGDRRFENDPVRREQNRMIIQHWRERQIP